MRYQFVDCRFELGSAGRGRELYLAGHIPGASFLDVDEDLSDLSVEGQGRHPLPSARRFAEVAGRAGIEQGVYVADGVRVERIEAPAVPVRDTTGAGDTFSGVLAAGLARGWELDRAARWATAAAALSVTKSGARGGMPTGAEIEAALAVS